MANYKSKFTGAQIDEGIAKALNAKELTSENIAAVLGYTPANPADIPGMGSVFKVTNESGWLAKTIADGSACIISLSWVSIEDEISTGNGTSKLTVNGVVKSVEEVQQGLITFDVAGMLILGDNTVAVTITDSFGNTRIIPFSINVVSAIISSYFDDSVAYTGEIPFNYIPVGAVEKTVHFFVDDVEVGTQIVTASNREQTYTFPAQTHGSHKITVYFTGTIDGYSVQSNTLTYDVICYQSGNVTPIITTTFLGGTFKQYGTVAISYIVYTPNALTSAITLRDGENTVTELTVDRTRQTWSYKAQTAGEKSLSIVSGDTVKEISFTVEETTINATAETNNLELYLTSTGRSNNENNPLSWGYNGVEAELTDFNLKSDGWKNDEDGNTVLRVSGDARVYIPFEIFASDFRTTGKTIEIEFATRNVRNYDAIVLSSWSGDRGIQITAQKATLKSEQSEVFTQYKEDEHIRVAFCIEKKAENRLLSIYINGIMSGVVQYPADDDFTQVTPVGISIGSNECTIDIYNIRIYSNNLTRYQIVDNWIADTQDVDLMIERYKRNDVFDDYGNISVDKLPETTPYLVLKAAQYSDLPQSKGDKKTVSGWYVDPLHEERCFTFENAQIDVQGTSSQFYSRKNYKIKFKNGFIVNGTPSDTYTLRDTSMPTSTFTFKADVASSEGANNVELIMFYEEAAPFKTPPQQTDSRVRQGIEGYPCLIFYHDNTNYHFIGKYNFNNDKDTEEVFGFQSGDESWEIRQNTTDMAVWKDDDFSGTAWQTTFEGRYPDGNTDTTLLQEFSTWLKSTDTTAVSTEEEKQERLNKFKNEFPNYCNVDAMLYNYLYTELFLMVDNRAKNAFPTRYDADGKWLILPYDYDTAIGINNEGELKFGYELEDTDLVNENYVFNGQDSVLYVNIRLAYPDELMAMYKELRTNPIFSYEEIEKRFEDHQSVWGESIFNEDGRFKYIEPLTNDGDNTYLPMAQGSKAEQRKWWLYNRFRYIDSKYNAGDSQTDYIMLRSYAVDDITVTPYADIYAAAKFDSALVRERALRGSSYTLKNPLSGGRDAVVSVYSASQLSSVGDLSGLKPGMADFHAATRLSSLKVGDESPDYDNPNLTNLTIGNLTLLQELDVRNCSSLTKSVDLSGCTNLERAYFEGTAITGVKLPDGGVLQTLHLPATVTSLQITNQPKLTDFSIPSYEGISTLRLENVPSEIDSWSIIQQIKARSRIRLVGVDWTENDMEGIEALYERLVSFRGIDENGNNLDNAVVAGTLHTKKITSPIYQAFQEYFPNLNIEYETMEYSVTFISDGEIVSTQLLTPRETITLPGDQTKESTAAYSYTFKGWGATDGGAVTTVPTIMGTRDLIFYAVFEATLRQYTVQFYNGSTPMQSVVVYYGNKAKYTGDEPTKEYYEFSGWDPEPTNVTGDMDCYAQFKPVAQIIEISDDWDTILDAVADGTYQDKYHIGNYKPLDLGSEGIVNMQIAALNADELADGSGNACITWVSKELLSSKHRMNSQLSGNGGSFSRIAGTNTWTTQNSGLHNTTCSSTWSIVAVESGSLTINCSVDSETFDTLTVAVDGTTVFGPIGGAEVGTHTIECEAGDTITVTASYVKDYSISSSSDTASITFDSTMEISITTEEAPVSIIEGTGTCGGWEYSEMRSYYKNTLEPLIPEAVRNAIKRVFKMGCELTTMGDYGYTESIEDVWAPSYREIFGDTTYEQSGPIYDTLFSGTSDKIKTLPSGSSGEWWWLRTPSKEDAGKYRCVSAYGTGSEVAADSQEAVVLCFCT